VVSYEIVNLDYYKNNCTTNLVKLILDIQTISSQSNLFDYDFLY